MYGTQAWCLECIREMLFENDVKMYGTQADADGASDRMAFENDVKMYGTQALNLKALLDG